MKKTFFILMILILAILTGCSVKEEVDKILLKSLPYNGDASVIESLIIADNLVDLNNFGETVDGSILQVVPSNDIVGAIVVEAKDGWKVEQILYFAENNTDLKIAGNYTIYNDSFEREEAAEPIKQNEQITFGECYTHFYVYLNDLSNEEKAKFVITYRPYDKIIVNWGEMIEGKTRFVFNKDYNEGGKILTDDFVMTYAKQDNGGTDVSKFMSKEEFVRNASDYGCFVNSIEYDFEDKGNQISIPVLRDCGLNSVRVENPGEGTSVEFDKS